MNNFAGTWYCNQVTGECHGNPSSAPLVGRYMRALRRRKAKDGEVPTSAKALSPKDMTALYKLCQQKGNFGARQWVCTLHRMRPIEVELWTNFSLYAVPILAVVPLPSARG